MVVDDGRSAAGLGMMRRRSTDMDVEVREVDKNRPPDSHRNLAAQGLQGCGVVAGGKELDGGDVSGRTEERADALEGPKLS